MFFFNMIGSHHVQGDASSQPDDLQEGAKEDRGEGQGGQGEREGESPLGEIEFYLDRAGIDYRGNHWTIIPEGGREEGASRACAAAT